MGNIYYWTMGIGAIVIASYIFNFIAAKTKIPSVLMLILGGFFLGQYIVLEDAVLEPSLSIIGSIGLILIVLEAALDLKLEKENISLMLKAFINAFVLLILTAVAISYVLVLYYGITFTEALVYAVPLSIMSSAIIIPSVDSLSTKRKEFLIYEASFSDILGIMFFYYLLDALKGGYTQEILLQTGQNLGKTIIIAIALGYILTIIIVNVKAEVKLFLPIAILLLLYSIGKYYDLSALVFVLTFGLLISNHQIFFFGALKRFMNQKAFKDFLDDIKLITLESSIIIRTFFFVVFGMSITMDVLSNHVAFLLGLIMIVIMMALRLLMIKITVPKLLRPTIYIAPRGLITILLYYQIPKEHQLAAFDPTILLVVIIVSSLIMMYGLITHKEEEDTTLNRRLGKVLDKNITTFIE